MQMLFAAVHESGPDPGCVKTHTSAKCGKYNSPTRYRAICAQHDLALMMRNFSNMFLRARRALEFSHGLDRQPTLATLKRRSAAVLCYPFGSETREALASEPPRIHHPPRHRSTCVAARGASAAPGEG